MLDKTCCEKASSFKIRCYVHIYVKFSVFGLRNSALDRNQNVHIYTALPLAFDTEIQFCTLHFVPYRVTFFQISTFHTVGIKTNYAVFDHKAGVLVDINEHSGFVYRKRPKITSQEIYCPSGNKTVGKHTIYMEPVSDPSREVADKTHRKQFI